MNRQPGGNAAALADASCAARPSSTANRVCMASESGGLTDSDIVQRVLDGDTDAFAVLVQRHGALVQRTVYRHVPRGHAEDVVQESFVRAFQSLANFAPGTRFPEWLATITVRACYDFWRSHYRSREAPESTLTEQHRDWAERVTAAHARERFDEETRRQEAREVLDYALDRLSPEDRMVVTLVHLEGMSIEQAARRLGWTAVNVKVRAHRSRRRMRRELEALLEGRMEVVWSSKTGTVKS